MNSSMSQAISEILSSSDAKPADWASGEQFADDVIGMCELNEWEAEFDRDDLIEWWNEEISDIAADMLENLSDGSGPESVDGYRWMLESTDAEALQMIADDPADFVTGQFDHYFEAEMVPPCVVWAWREAYAVSHQNGLANLIRDLISEKLAE